MPAGNTISLAKRIRSQPPTGTICSGTQCTWWLKVRVHRRRKHLPATAVALLAKQRPSRPLPKQDSLHDVVEERVGVERRGAVVCRDGAVVPGVGPQRSANLDLEVVRLQKQVSSHIYRAGQCEPFLRQVWRHLCPSTRG